MGNRKRRQKMGAVSTFLLITFFLGTASPRSLDYQFNADESYGLRLEQNEIDVSMNQIDREDCIDAKGSAFCEKRKEKCDKQSVADSCKKTCDLCPTTTTTTTTTTTATTTTTITIEACKDEKSQNFCNKNKKKCKKDADIQK